MWVLDSPGLGSTPITDMASTIALDGYTELGILMNNSGAARPITMPASWSVLRLSLRIRVGNWGTLVGPDLSFGLQSGTANKLGDATTDNFVGFSMDGQTSHADGDYDYDIAIRSRKRVGATTTFGGAGPFGTNFKLRHASQYGTIWIGEITKGSPNYSFRFFSPPSGSATGANQTAATFNRVAWEMNPVLSGNSWSASQTLAVDESTDGTLNAFALYWNKTGVLYICDYAVALVAS